MTAQPYTALEIEQLQRRGDPATTEVARLLATVDNLRARLEDMTRLANLHLDIGARASLRAEVCPQCRGARAEA